MTSLIGPVVRVQKDGTVTKDDVVTGRIERVGESFTWKAYDANGQYLITVFSRGQALSYVKWMAS